MKFHDEQGKFGQSGTLEQRTKSYSMAAAAAGVSLLALAAPAEGKVVITTHISIPVTGTVTIDFNHDGVADLELMMCGYSDGRFKCGSAAPLGFYSTYLSARPFNGGGVLEKKQTGLASNLARSAPIGQSGYFGKYGLLARRAGTAYTTATRLGNWGSGQPNHFLGVKIIIHGTTHYGWVRVTVKNPTGRGPITATITEYGYETIANKKVLAGLASNNAKVIPEKASGGSLGMLALGAEGLPMWRREDPVIARQQVN